VESQSDRRVRTVSLSEKGRRVFLPIFREHAALIKHAFQDVSPKERRQMEDKRIGRGAEELAENEGHPQNDVLNIITCSLKPDRFQRGGVDKPACCPLRTSLSV
jgi:hypothetical protein